MSDNPTELVPVTFTPEQLAAFDAAYREGGGTAYALAVARAAPPLTERQKDGIRAAFRGYEIGR